MKNNIALALTFGLALLMANNARALDQVNGTALRQQASGGVLISVADTDVQAKVKKSMGLLQDMLGKLGAPKIEGTSDVAGKTVPSIVFGSAKINGNFDVVDAVVKEMGGTATIFVKAGEEYVRISTNVLKDDGTRAIGTQLAHNPAYEAINGGKAFYGQVDILGKPYETGYEPIKDASGKAVGIYYVGYKLP
jgi:Cache 3/Cache 2 fusion domain